MTSQQGTTIGTVEEYTLTKCPWYYQFESVFNAHPGVNPPIIFESGQPYRRNGQDVEETNLGGFEDNGDDAEGDDETDNDSLHSIHSLKARSAKTIRATVEKTLVPPMSDDEDDAIIDMPTARTLPIRSKTAPIETTEQSSPKPTPKTIKASSKTTPKEKTKTTRDKKKRSRSEDLESEEETSKNRRSQWKKRKGRRTER